MIKRFPGGTSSRPDVSRSRSSASNVAWLPAVNQSERVRLGLSLMKLSPKFETPSQVPLLVPKKMLPTESIAGPCPDIQRLPPSPVGEALKTATGARFKAL